MSSATASTSLKQKQQKKNQRPPRVSDDDDNDNVDNNGAGDDEQQQEEGAFPTMLPDAIAEDGVTFEKIRVDMSLFDEPFRLLKWTTPTKIQAAVIPEALDKKDVIALAETGSGYARRESFSLLLLDDKGKSHTTQQKQQKNRSVCDSDSSIDARVGSRTWSVCGDSIADS